MVNSQDIDQDADDGNIEEGVTVNEVEFSGGELTVHRVLTGRMKMELQELVTIPDVLAVLAVLADANGAAGRIGHFNNIAGVLHNERCGLVLERELRQLRSDCIRYDNVDW